MKNQNFESEEPINKVPFSAIIDTLIDEDKIIPPKTLFRLSDLSPQETSELEKIWPQLSKERKINLLEDLESLNEQDLLVSFINLYKIAYYDKDPFVRKIALRATWGYDNENLPKTILEIIGNDNNLDVKVQGIKTLGFFINLATLDKLSQATRDELVNGLIEIYQTTKIDSVKQAALESLGYLNRDDVTSFIESAYISHDIDWKKSALISMGNSADALWESNVIEFLDSEEDILRLEATRAAGEIPLKNAVQHIIQNLQHPNDEIQIASIWALSEIGGEEAYLALSFMLNNIEDENLIDIIEEALENLEFNDDQLDFNLFDIDSQPDQF